MKEPIYILDNETEDSLSLKENLLKYLVKWPWFLGSIILCTLIGFLYLRYTPIIYATEAQIKIIDDSKEFNIATDALSLLGAGSRINLDNEIAVIKSYRLLEQVVNTIHLDIEYYEVGNVKTQQIFETPVVVTKLFQEPDIEKSIVYKIYIDNNDTIEITNPKDETILMNNSSISFTKTDFPIKIDRNKDFNLEKHRGKNFLIKINNRKKTVLQLIKNIEVNPITATSDVLSIKTENESSALSESILNELIMKFNTDGILDRQLVSKRTLDFIDDRFIYLSKELDSIEINKKEYKQANNLSYIQADAGVTIEKKSIAESEVFRIETQIELSKLLKKTLENMTIFSLLPADIGVENANINILVNEYNQVVLQREKLITSAGLNNPAVQLLSEQLKRAKLNIINTVNTYQNQLKISVRQLRKKENNAGAMFLQLPQKEKRLRSIERQQVIKENLFLLLLQKREEAAINFAVTAPSLKVVDYGLTSLDPIAPKKKIILLIALILGVLMPLGFFFVKFTLDTKIKNKVDLEKLAAGIPILAEIPSLKDPNSILDIIDERSVKAESFRILAMNVNYVLPKKQDKTGHVIYVTSSVKGEGKTLIAINLAAAFASLKKKVLLIGADLRNPQLHNYFNIDKNINGLSNFLHNSEINWKNCIHKESSTNSLLDICFSGPIPPNASQLITGNNLEKLLNYAKEEYDYIILDTAPTIPIADTLLISNHADMTVFITRSGYTDKSLLQFSKDLSKTEKLKNMAYVLNDVEFNKRTGYNYGYEYGYE